MIKSLWNKIKSWSGWDEAGTIFKARLETLVGVLLAGATGLIAFDWMPIFTSGTIDWKHVGMVAAYLFVSGVVTEIVRRRNATDL